MRFFFPAARPVLPRRLLLLLLLLLVGPGRGWAQGPAFTQAVSFNPRVSSFAIQDRVVATDAAGNQYVTGNFSGTLVLGSSTLVSAGSDDLFVAKRSAATGSWLWAVRAGGSGNEGGKGMAVDAGGNVLVTGYFNGTASFGTGPAPVVLVSAGGNDVFVAKFGVATGACAWAVRAGSSGADVGLGLAVDAGGNALITGYFNGTASFGTSPAATALVSAGGTDVFVAKFGAAAGACIWAVAAGGSNNDVGNRVAADANGNALVTGSFNDTASFGTGSVPVALVSAGSRDVFVAKFGAAVGACIWAVQAGSIYFDDSYGVAVDASGNALVTGSCDGLANFGSFTLPSGGLTTGFVAKFGAATGACTWAVQATAVAAPNGGGAGSFGVAVDAGGNALVTGFIFGTAGFATSPSPTFLTTTGFRDIFVAKFGAATGACAWAVQAGGNGNALGDEIAVDASGNAVVTGTFQGAASFGNLAVTGGNGPNENTGFVAVLGGAGTLPTRAPSLVSPFTLSPNPARTACQVQGIAAGAAVTVLDALGRPLARAVANASGTAWLALPAGLAPGLYLVRSGGQVRRLVVE